jgi:hypothetical protein
MSWSAMGGNVSILFTVADFNLGHMDWETLSVFPGKPNQKQHQQFLDIINDNSR